MAIIAVTAIEDITIVLQDISIGTYLSYQVVKIQRKEGLANTFYDQPHKTLTDATRDYVTQVANEVALHAYNGMVELSRKTLTIDMPEF